MPRIKSGMEGKELEVNKNNGNPIILGRPNPMAKTPNLLGT